MMTMSIESQINCAYEEKLTLHSRENEDPCICESCNKDPAECNYDPFFCEICAKEAAEESKMEAKKDEEIA